MVEAEGAGEEMGALQMGKRRLITLLDSAIVILMVLILLVMSWPVSLALLPQSSQSKASVETPSSAAATAPGHSHAS